MKPINVELLHLHDDGKEQTILAEIEMRFLPRVGESITFNGDEYEVVKVNHLFFAKEPFHEVSLGLKWRRNIEAILARVRE